MLIYSSRCRNNNCSDDGMDISFWEMERVVVCSLKDILCRRQKSPVTAEEEELLRKPMPMKGMMTGAGRAEAS